MWILAHRPDKVCRTKLGCVFSDYVQGVKGAFSDGHYGIGVCESVVSIFELPIKYLDLLGYREEVSPFRKIYPANSSEK